MKSNPGNTISHFFVFTTQGFYIFWNWEISTRPGAIWEQLADLNLWIIIDYSLVQWKELGEEGPTDNEWEDRKIRRRKDFLVSIGYFIISDFIFLYNSFDMWKE